LPLGTLPLSAAYLRHHNRLGKRGVIGHTVIPNAHFASSTSVCDLVKVTRAGAARDGFAGIRPADSVAHDSRHSRTQSHVASVFVVDSSTFFMPANSPC
jgi:hypothetical protein